VKSTAANSFGHAGPHRNEGARQAVLDAADDLLVERGFAGVTMEGIATKAGVAKQTIYRWWKSKVDVLLDNLEQDGEMALAWPVSDATPTDRLISQLTRIENFLHSEAAGKVMQALIGQALHDRETAQKFREGFLFNQRKRDLAGLREVLEELDCAPKDERVLEELLDQIIGPIHYRSLVLGQRSDQELLVRSVEAMLRDAQVRVQR